MNSSTPLYSPPSKVAKLLSALSPVRSIRARLVLIVLVVESVILTLMAMNNLRLLTSSMTAQATQYVESQAPVLSAAVLTPMIQDDYATIQSILEEGRSNSNLIYLGVINSKGNKIASSGSAPPDNGASASTGNLAISPFGKRSTRYDVSIPVTISGQQFGYIQIGLDISNIWKAIDQLLIEGFLILMLALFISAALLIGLLHLTVTRHMTAIVQGIKQLEQGNYQHRFVKRTSDEMGLLANSLNYMSNSVAQAFESLREAKNTEEERLSVKVEQRTAELEKSNALLKTTLNELQTTQSQLIQSEKMASLGQLVANVAHEINTPIGAVKSSGHNIADALSRVLKQLPPLLLSLDDVGREAFLNLIASANRTGTVMSTREERQVTRQLTQHFESLGLAQTRHKAEAMVQLRAHEHPDQFLVLLQRDDCDAILAVAGDVATIVNSTDNINTAVERASKIVFALKSYARTDNTGEFRPADIREGVETVLTLYQNQMRHGIELVYHSDQLPPVNCLVDELNQVWTNLIHNALQAMNHQGTLSIELKALENEVQVSVGDSGSGIPEHIRERIFDPFFTTKPVGEGSGLGLDIVRKIVTKHGGRISFDTALGIGSTFMVVLPINQEKTEA